MKKTLVCLIAVISMILAVSVNAGVPSILNYQGYLTGPPPSSGPINGERELRFSIFEDETAGSFVWQEIHSVIDIDRGVFQALLGTAGSPLLDTYFDSGFSWLQIEVRDVGSSAPYEVLDPRIRLTTVPYAFRVASVDSASGGAISGDVEIRDGRLGIGTSNPQANLHIGGVPGVDGIMFPDGSVQTTAAPESSGSEVTVITGTATHGALIAPPAGYTVAECKCIVSPHTSGPSGSSQEAYRHWCYVTEESEGWRVTARSQNAHYGGYDNDIANYMVIGVR